MVAILLEISSILTCISVASVLLNVSSPLTRYKENIMQNRISSNMAAVLLEISSILTRRKYMHFSAYFPILWQLFY